MNAKLAAFAALCMLALACAPTASAHATYYSEDGKIKIVWGFLNEPAVTMTKTGLDLILTDNETGAPINGVTANDLKAELHYGDDHWEFEDFRAQFGQPGRYTGTITLTKAGLYELHLEGTINGTEVELELPGAHEIEAIEDTYFPPYNATSGDYSALAARVAALEAKAQTQSTTPATLTPQPTGGAIPAPAAVAVLGVLAAVAVGLALRRRD